MKPQNQIHYRNAGAGNGGRHARADRGPRGLATQLNSAFTEHADAVDEALAERDTTLGGIRGQLGAIEASLARRSDGSSGGGGGGASFETLGEQFHAARAFESLPCGRDSAGHGVCAELRTRTVTAAARSQRSNRHRRDAVNAEKSTRFYADLFRMAPTTRSSIDFVRFRRLSQTTPMLSARALKNPTISSTLR